MYVLQSKLAKALLQPLPALVFRERRRWDGRDLHLQIGDHSLLYAEPCKGRVHRAHFRYPQNQFANVAPVLRCPFRIVHRTHAVEECHRTQCYTVRSDVRYSVCPTDLHFVVQTKTAAEAAVTLRDISDRQE